MALLNTYTNLHNGLNIPAAYNVVTSIQWDKKLNVATANVDVFVNKQIRDDNLINGAIGQYNVNLPANVSAVDEVYTFMKTQPEFSSAVDA